VQNNKAQWKKNEFLLVSWFYIFTAHICVLHTKHVAEGFKEANPKETPAVPVTQESRMH
jgi:hypothetical protein